LTGKRRDNFTRECCDAIKQHTMYPSKEEKDKVALMIIEAYPFLADSLGAGIVSHFSYYIQSSTILISKIQNCQTDT
jgi:hypothetical protein